MSKLKPQSWDSLPRQSKLAAVMYPELVPEHIRHEMQSIAYGEGKTDPLTAKRRSEMVQRKKVIGRR
jgi:hypothetical protein